MEKRSPLLKVLSLWDSIAISIGVAIGVGIFRVPSELAKVMPIPQLIIIAWFMGGLFSIIGALCYAELSSSLPETGGDYVYIRESYNHLAAFLYGWTSILVIRTGIIAAVSFVFAEYASSLLSLDHVFVKPIAIMSILFLSIINGVKIHTGKNILNISVLAKIVALIAIIIFAFTSKEGNIKNLYYIPQNNHFNILYMFGLALVPILWTYGGWHENTFMTGETKNAQRVLPIALISGTLSITIIYVFLNIVYLYLIPIRDMINADLIAGEVMKVIFGKWAKKAMEALIIISSFGTLNAVIMTSSRITYAMSSDNPFFRYLSHVHNNFKTPFRAIMVNGLWSIILVIWGSFNKLLFFTGLLVWIFFATIIFGVIVLRIRYPDLERPFRVWGYPVTPLIFVAICLWICVDICLKYPGQSIVGILIMLSGIPIYLFTRRKIEIKKLCLILPLLMFITPGIAMDFSSLRDRMVRHQIISRGVKDKRVIDAMLKVPRHLFVPEKYRKEAYDDHPLPIGYDQTISQPYIVALMTEALMLKDTDRVLEIGTGSGYQTAILAEIAKEVYSIEIMEGLAKKAMKLLAYLGYKNVHIRTGDGYKGWPEKAPFDAIIVTCAPEAIPKPLVEQLKEGGRMVVPVGRRYGIQKLLLITKHKGRIHTKTLTLVSFVPMLRESP